MFVVVLLEVVVDRDRAPVRVYIVGILYMPSQTSILPFSVLAKRIVALPFDKWHEFLNNYLLESNVGL